MDYQLKVNKSFISTSYNTVQASSRLNNRDQSLNSHRDNKQASLNLDIF